MFGTMSGANGVRPRWAQMLPAFLKPLGYRSYHSGKWHMDGDRLPAGFDHSYSLEDPNRFFSPQSHFEDDVQLPPVDPGSGYYSTRFIADHAIKCLKEHAGKFPDKPFFEYLAFTAPHFPLQALPEDIAIYKDRYQVGWDAIRNDRLARMKKLGIVDCALSPLEPGTVPRWNLTDEELHEQISANELGHAVPWDSLTPGSAKSYLGLGSGWSSASNTPFRLHKSWTHEGGITTPLIVHWPAGIHAHGELRHDPGHLIDLVPTALEVTGATRPAEVAGLSVPPLPGKSLTPAFAKDGSIKRDSLWFYHDGHCAIRVGDWKLVRKSGEPWEPYNLRTDRSETRNLAASESVKVNELELAWLKEADELRRLAQQDLPAGQSTPTVDPNAKPGATPPPVAPGLTISANKLKLKPGTGAEYKKRHDAIWPELSKAIRDAGISDYSIFLDEETGTLFAVQKVATHNTTAELRKTELMQKWWAHMADIMEVNPDNSPARVPLKQVFHQD